MKEYPLLKKLFVNYHLKYMKDNLTTEGYVPWILGGDESGAFMPGDELRYATYVMVGVPFFTYNIFANSLSTKNGKLTDDQLVSVLGLLKDCYGCAIIIYFDLSDSRTTRMIERHKAIRKKSTLPTPGKTAHIVWIDALAFSVIELVGFVSVHKKAPVGLLHIHYDDRSMTDLMKALMSQYVPNQMSLRLREIFEGVIQDAGFNPFPKANPEIIEFGKGRTTEPLILASDLIARSAFRSLKTCGQIQLEHQTIYKKNLTDILLHNE